MASDLFNRHTSTDGRPSLNLRGGPSSNPPSSTASHNPHSTPTPQEEDVPSKSSRPGASSTPINDSALKLQAVTIDSLVLMKIIKHCRDNYPTPVSGQLLGMESNTKLEITNAFALPERKDLLNAILKARPSAEDVDERVEEEMEKYQEKMAELMHDVNIDCFTVGWYQTLSFADLKNKDILDSLVLYQQVVENAVVIGFDPLLNAAGRMAFKAYHISEKFLSIYRSSAGDVSKINRFRGKDILVEIPIEIRNTSLVEAYLLEWAMSDPLQTLVEFDSLELDHNSYLEQNLSTLSSSLEELMEEQEKLQKYQREHVKQLYSQKQLQERTKLENEQRLLSGEAIIPMEYSGPAYRHIELPSQIQTLLISNHAELQCKEITTICAESLAKTFLLSKGVSKR